MSEVEEFEALAARLQEERDAKQKRARAVAKRLDGLSLLAILTGLHECHIWEIDWGKVARAANLAQIDMDIEAARRKQKTVWARERRLFDEFMTPPADAPPEEEYAALARRARRRRRTRAEVDGIEAEICRLEAERDKLLDRKTGEA